MFTTFVNMLYFNDKKVRFCKAIDVKSDLASQQPGYYMLKIINKKACISLTEHV